MLVILFLSYYLSATCFYHTHTYSWGVVSHSHFGFPFGNNPGQHHHTQSQCQTIQLLSCIVLAFLTTATIYKITKIQQRAIPVCRYKIYFRHITLKLRAPPTGHR